MYACMYVCIRRERENKRAICPLQLKVKQRAEVRLSSFPTSSSTPCLARGWRRFPLRRPRRVRERRADGHVVRRFLDCGQDWRVKAAILQCASIASSAGGELSQDHANKETPALVMTGRGELVIKQEGNDVCERYYETHTGPKCFMEIMKGGHMSFTSCEMCIPEYGKGIGSSCPSRTAPGETYEPTPTVEQRTAINAYALAFLDANLRGS